MAILIVIFLYVLVHPCGQNQQELSSLDTINRRLVSHSIQICILDMLCGIVSVIAVFDLM